MKEQHASSGEQEQRQSMSDGHNRTDGRRFGNYDLIRRIDVGGMGEVYLAHQRTAFGREVAVKIIRADLVHDVTARQRFLREAEMSAHLKHEHILPLVEFGEEQGRLFLVTPYIQGGTLARRLQSGPLALTEIHQLFTALVQAVAYIHKRGVIHRDLKPSNVLLDQQEGSNQTYVRLIDFGIATIPGALANPPLTTAGNEVGTLAYMAPERLEGIAAASNDIYSLGIILYQMLTGQLPDTQNVAPLPEPLEALVHRCVVVNPAKRFASAEELLQAFDHTYRTLTITTLTQPRSQFPKVTPAVPTSAPTPSIFSPSTPSATPMPALSSKPAGSATPMPALPTKPVSSTSDTSDATVPTLDETITDNTAKPGIVARPLSTDTNAAPEPRVHSPAGIAGAGQLRAQRPFSGDDYNAPTMWLDPAKQFAQTGPTHRFADEAVLTRPPARVRSMPKARPSLFVFIPFSIIVVLLLIFGLGLILFKTAVTANITVSPRAYNVSKVYNIAAKPGLPQADDASASIPISTLTKQAQESKTGATTGTRIFCFLPSCPKIVDARDINLLAGQIHQDLVAQITKDLNSQVRGQNGTAVSKPVCNDVAGSGSANPPEGQQSNTVTVTLMVECVVSYYRNSDARNMALHLLQRDVGTHAALLDQLTKIGQPVIKGTDQATSTVKLAVPAAGVAVYQISADELAGMKNQIKGMTLKNARAYIVKQPGIDGQNVVVKVSYGDAIPTDVQQIQIVPVNPVNVPSVQLPAVQAVATPGA
jgi:serine/threonine protein kinase